MTGMNRYTFARPVHTRLLRYTALTFLAATRFGVADDQANWPRWRGPRDNGSVESGTYPAKFEKVLWKAPLPGKINLVERFGPDTLYWDHGTSPVLSEKYVIMVRMHNGESWLAAFDKATGQMRWKVARNYQTPTEGDNAYTTPIVTQHRGKEAVLVWGAEHVTAHDAADGNLLWSSDDFNPESNAYWPAVASPVISGDVAV